MQYLATTQPTANWLLTNTAVREALRAELPRLSELSQLRVGVLSVGSLRIAANKSQRVIGMWNADYLSATGEEKWGVARLNGGMGLFDNLDIYVETFERWLYLVNQRLQGLMIDAAYIHRSHSNGVHSCLSGRNAARQFSFGYVERDAAVTQGASHGILCVGPSDNLASVKAESEVEWKNLPALLEAADSLLEDTLRRPALDSAAIGALAGLLRGSGASSSIIGVDVPRLETAVPEASALSTLHFAYDRWVEGKSPLTANQRRILESDALSHQPLRILGAAGSGKTLVMQLLAMRQLLAAAAKDEPCKVLFLTHNAQMREAVKSRFITLEARDFFDAQSPQKLEVSTLLDVSVQGLELPPSAIINNDARETKEYQSDVVTACLEKVFADRRADVEASQLLSQILRSEEFIDVFGQLVAQEIGIAIKGRNLGHDRKTYVESVQHLSRLHGVLDPSERDVVFDVFEMYQRQYLDAYEVLDSDDVAITMLGRLRTPLWEMRRRKTGYDFLFVDETQLFNENERRLFALLTKGDKAYAPIALALDEAQELRGVTSSGFGLLGIESIKDEQLQSVHRCTKAILSLAFKIVQQSTDLFCAGFPDFTKGTVSVIGDDHKSAAHPRLVTAGTDSPNMGRFVLRQVRTLRKRNLRQIGVIIHADRYWEEIRKELIDGELPLVEVTERGERVDPDKPAVILTLPEYVGGQEFDAVIAVGIEQGIVPPRVEGHPGLAATLEQRAIREVYLSFTRARYQLLVANSRRSVPSSFLQQAIDEGLLRDS